MAIGDIRKCQFCLKDFQVPATGRACLLVCGVCEQRHKRSKQKKIKSEIPICGNVKVSNEERYLRAQAGHKKDIELVGVQLNWGASKK